MCVHIALTTMTFALCKLWWASYVAHTAFLLFIFAISAWNGAAPSPAVHVPHSMSVMSGNVSCKGAATSSVTNLPTLQACSSGQDVQFSEAWHDPLERILMLMRPLLRSKSDV